MFLLPTIILKMAQNRSDQGLSIDFEALEKLLNEASDSADALTSECNNVKKNVSDLKREWNTDAGRKFFESLDSDWAAGVEKYTLTMATFKEVIKNLKETMQTLYDESASNVYITMDRLPALSWTDVVKDSSTDGWSR